MRELDIRILLNDFLHDRFVLHDPSCIIVDEFGLCQGAARIDVAVINGSIHGYEIKSEQDTLNRVKGQLDVYTKTLDYLSFVTNEKHVPRLEKEIPEWCGLIVVDSDGNLRTIREARENLDIDPYSLAQLLWRDETIAILRQLGYSKGLSKPRSFLWKELAHVLPISELNECVRETLKARTTWRVDRLQCVDDDSLLRSASL